MLLEKLECSVCLGGEDDSAGFIFLPKCNCGSREWYVPRDPAKKAKKNGRTSSSSSSSSSNRSSSSSSSSSSDSAEDDGSGSVDLPSGEGTLHYAKSEQKMHYMCRVCAEKWFKSSEDVQIYSYNDADGKCISQSFTCVFFFLVLKSF